MLAFPPVMSYPTKHDKFILTTDASDTGLGAVLSMKHGTVIEFASLSLSSPEKNYATIEKECLAIVWAVRKFKRYLIGAHFIIQTDHKPLEWLESSKSSKAHSQRLERWSLELRGFDFTLVHRPGSLNDNTDALSRRPVNLVGLTPPMDVNTIKEAQLKDKVLSRVYEQISKNTTPPSGQMWNQSPLCRYKQTWSQLVLHQSILCRKILSPSLNEAKYLIIVPQALHKQFLVLCHDNSGH